MAVPRLTQGLVNLESSHGAINTWPSEEVLRIEALLDEEVHAELLEIMEGRNYSWNKISQFLQGQLECGALEFTVKDGDVLFEWNNLCDEKRHWERKQCLSIESRDFDRDCLINLKLIPIQGGIGFQGSQLVTVNLDEPSTSTMDLWVYTDKWESEILSDSDKLSWDSEDSEESKYGEDNDYDDDNDDYEGNSYDLNISDDDEGDIE